MGEEYKENIEKASSVSDDSSIALSCSSSSGRKKKVNKFEVNAPIVIDGQKLFQLITAHSEASGKSAKQFSLKGEWASIASEYYKTKYTRKHQVRRLYNYYNRHLLTLNNSVKNENTPCYLSPPSKRGVKNRVTTECQNGKGSQFLSIAKEIVHDACAGIIESAIRQTVSAFNEGLVNSQPQLNADVINHVQNSNKVMSTLLRSPSKKVEASFDNHSLSPKTLKSFFSNDDDQSKGDYDYNRNEHNQTKHNIYNTDNCKSNNINEKTSYSQVPNYLGGLNKVGRVRKSQII